MAPREYDEKRDFRRMVLDCPVSYHDPATGEGGTGVLRNLSGSGLLMTCEREIPTGTRLHINVTPERSLVPPLDAEVEVVRVTPAEGGFEIGLSITGFNPPG